MREYSDDRDGSEYIIPPGQVHKGLVDHIADYCYNQDVSTVDMFATLAEIHICILKSKHIDEPTRRELGIYGILIHSASDDPKSATVANFGVTEELAS